MSKGNYTDVSDLADAIANELSRYNKEITEGIKEKVDKTMERLVENTKKDAPVGRRKGKYKKAISSRVVFDGPLHRTQQWYVKAPHYRLAHLLNNGHALRDGGRYEGDGHITKNEEKAIEEIERGVEEVIRDSGN
ncbi:HK97 gp10 family phage protein [Bacillus sp. JJ722]|uniref:HK97 gp10 family phage protein n=1 Tax=Bacillus sp. JJ722 TaxID=3122973 RepID=UPI002FFF80F0